MNHTANGPTVSFEVAQKLERETAEHLLKHRKLSLIVDLDQTIVHATVDPTVGEWIAEGEAWEKRERRRAQRKTKRQAREAAGDGASSSSSDSSDEDGEDEVNPNWEALKDVKRFRLSHDTGAPIAKGKGKEKAVDQGCLYYVKPRCVTLIVHVPLPLLLMSHPGPACKSSSKA